MSSVASDLSDGWVEGTQKWRVYGSNPRAASLFLSPRLSKYGSGTYSFRTVLQESILDTLFPKSNAKYRTSRGGAMKRRVLFLVPEEITLKKTDSFSTMWKATHDPRTVAIVVSDEDCERFFDEEVIGPAGWSRPTMRNYWDDSFTLMRQQSSSTPWYESSGKTLRYFPLGPRYEFLMVGEEERVAPSDRQYLFNMMTSLNTNPARLMLDEKLRALMDQHKDDASSSKSKGPTLPTVRDGFVHNTATWQLELPKEVQEGLAMPAEEYRRVLLQSVFTLCPSGHNPETFRIFEAAEAGSIPIVDYTDLAGTSLPPC